jgi:hypothetical protein
LQGLCESSYLDGDHCAQERLISRRTLEIGMHNGLISSSEAAQVSQTHIALFAK